MSNTGSRYLSEKQNASFDAEYHSESELSDKLNALSTYFDGRGNEPLRILDVGGGNGRFLDRVLEFFPGSIGTLIDISSVLISANRPHPRKHIVHGDLYNIVALLNGQQFDIIFVNWVIHHLVGRSHSECVGKAIHFLESLSTFLADRGLVVVAENLYDGWFQSNIPSRVIFAITSVSNPVVLAVSRRFANTAGVGVCFQSERAWSRVFLHCGLEEEIGRRYGKYWDLPMWMGALWQIRHGHFFLARRQERNGEEHAA